METRIIKFRFWNDEIYDEDLGPANEMIYQDEMDDVEEDFGKYYDAAIQTRVTGDVWRPKIMQFTGLKDKDGYEIYEGDIVDVEEHYENDRLIPRHRLKVCFLEDGFSLCHLDLPGNQYVLGLYQEVINERIEIIGNIYETPEKLREVKKNENIE